MIFADFNPPPPVYHYSNFMREENKLFKEILILSLLFYILFPSFSFGKRLDTSFIILPPLSINFLTCFPSFILTHFKFNCLKPPSPHLICPLFTWFGQCNSPHSNDNCGKCWQICMQRSQFGFVAGVDSTAADNFEVCMDSLSCVANYHSLGRK